MDVKEITLHAQLTAKAFYARLGYREEGEVFEEGRGITLHRSPSMPGKRGHASR